MRTAALLCGMAGLLAACAPRMDSPAIDAASFTPPPTSSGTPIPLGSADTAPTPGDVVVVLASDSFFGPDTADAATAARYYCSSRGKLSEFLSRERPHEMHRPIVPEYAVLTYRCVPPSGSAH